MAPDQHWHYCGLLWITLPCTCSVHKCMKQCSCTRTPCHMQASTLAAAQQAQLYVCPGQHSPSCCCSCLHIRDHMLDILILGSFSNSSRQLVVCGCSGLFCRRKHTSLFVPIIKLVHDVKQSKPLEYLIRTQNWCTATEQQHHITKGT